ncbi:helix-turn-helix domain-containing protein [Pseudogemmobacter bohemicus]|uniref:helix-turn-helix domain-containing protein n=1 Tax=Pseudogemmobacter bohemicus TaxID=2250708 RepID=UPI000DD44720|nr:helix-turn-helix transcriptional regulator [Pseudogemmobacter bohemicus]
MTREEFIEARKAMNMTQTDVADQMGMSLRQIQSIEKGEAELRRVHILAMERISLAYAAASGEWQIALPPVRRDAMDVVALFRGKEPV